MYAIQLGGLSRRNIGYKAKIFLCLLSMGILQLGCNSCPYKRGEATRAYIQSGAGLLGDS
jgi:hypothetical protein